MEYGKTLVSLVNNWRALICRFYNIYRYRYRYFSLTDLYIRFFSLGRPGMNTKLLDMLLAKLSISSLVKFGERGMQSFREMCTMVTLHENPLSSVSSGHKSFLSGRLISLWKGEFASSSLTITSPKKRDLKAIFIIIAILS